jgi:hypothetical protein
MIPTSEKLSRAKCCCVILLKEQEEQDLEEDRIGYPT